jgi:hypothetical protein
MSVVGAFVNARAPGRRSIWTFIVCVCVRVRVNDIPRALQYEYVYMYKCTVREEQGKYIIKGEKFIADVSA